MGRDTHTHTHGPIVQQIIRSRHRRVRGRIIKKKKKEKKKEAPGQSVKLISISKER